MAEREAKDAAKEEAAETAALEARAVVMVAVEVKERSEAARAVVAMVVVAWDNCEGRSPNSPSQRCIPSTRLPILHHHSLHQTHTGTCLSMRKNSEIVRAAAKQ
jgi:hypothetical protein